MQTPVAFLVFNRPDTTQQVFNAIRQAKPPKLLVVADGPRGTHPDDIEKCAAVRAIIDTVDWDCEVIKRYSDENLGSYKNNSTGLTWVFEQVEEAIILEDDCLPNLSFFRFCEELLGYYRNDTRIGLISGDNFQFGRKRTKYSYYFSRYTHIWGWATWKRTWKYMDLKMKNWPELNNSSDLRSIFSDSNTYRYWINKFQAMYLRKRKPAWDYQLMIAASSQNLLTIIPEINLVSNIGFGSRATNTKLENSPFSNMKSESINFPLRHPRYIIPNFKADQFTQNYKFGFWPRVYRKLRNLI
ncbi:hypothetical protein [Picosynechococcus sp. NKBG042902]|uniref:hypothetical protein n=1 Tax=Picosynechococcus sp. NKBG042902 TaxID=490193 RepID=UPI0004AACDFD|nr:hypothetical protein [Picosynechococcus sp. NKBG042902]